MSVATRTVPYGRMIEVMGTIKQGGFNKVALLVEQTDGAPGSSDAGHRGADRAAWTARRRSHRFTHGTSAAAALTRQAHGHGLQGQIGPRGAAASTSRST